LRTTNRSPDSPSAESLEISIKRTRKILWQYVRNNRFDLFATFTFNQAKIDRTDTEKCDKAMNNWFNLQQKRHGKFEYLSVPELHKDGAIHFHVLLKNYPGKLKEAINTKKTSRYYGQKLLRNGRQIYSIPGFTLGGTTVVKIDDNEESHAKVGNYIGKYITKDMQTKFGKRRYRASRGLLKPKQTANPEFMEKHVPLTPKRVKTTTHGTIVTYDREDLTRHTETLTTDVPQNSLFDCREPRSTVLENVQLL
jgi:hypothetical protein